MKLSCGNRFAEKQKRMAKWHHWFAWRPVQVGPGDCRWLEFVWRRGEYTCGYDMCSWDWEYRAMNDVPTEARNWGRGGHGIG